MADTAKKKDEKSKEKRLAKRFIAIFLIAAAVIVALYAITFKKSEKDEKYETTVVSQLDEVYPSINPFPADYDKDLSSYEPVIMYVFSSGNSFAINDIDEGERNEAQRFFMKYFDVLKNGGEGYSSLFTKSYKNDPRGFEKEFDRTFPPQKVYDVTVKELLRTADGGGGEKYTYEGRECDFGYYLVSYKINRNDGLFRRDLYSEEIERPLVFELVTFGRGTDKEETYIKNMYTESSISKE